MQENGQKGTGDRYRCLKQFSYKMKGKKWGSTQRKRKVKRGYLRGKKSGWWWKTSSREEGRKQKREEWLEPCLG